MFLKFAKKCLQVEKLKKLFPKNLKNHTMLKRGSEKSVFSSDYINEWYHFLDHSPYGNYSDWYDAIEVGNKQGIIAV